jgi:hypothetical protein
MKISSGNYTIEGSDLYWSFSKKYSDDIYVKCKLTLFYKKGTMKGVQLERKNYKLYWDKIQHWERYDG